MLALHKVFNPQVQLIHLFVLWLLQCLAIHLMKLWLLEALAQGSTIELSADAPVVEPYTLYMQGGLTLEYGKLSILLALTNMENKMPSASFFVSNNMQR